MKKQLLGVNITVDGKELILQEIQNYFQKKEKASSYVIVTPNPEQLVLARKDEAFLKLLNRADVAIPDGIGLVWAMQFLKNVHTVRISGIDFLSDLVRLANKNAYPIGLIGGWNGVAEKALEELKISYANLSGWAKEPEELSVEKMAQHIMDSGTKIIFVGLGAPKQEQYIDSIKKHCTHVVFMAVGGSFDMIAGAIPRAPQWMQDTGLEWFYRLVREPWRLGRQMALFQFILLVLKEKYFS
jgi:N-acetylglucosaminyldiphosphoundecaprenol N-acetyl-beta-D-mannosaminyltransferase